MKSKKSELEKIRTYLINRILEIIKIRKLNVTKKDLSLKSSIFLIKEYINAEFTMGCTFPNDGQDKSPIEYMMNNFNRSEEL